MKNKIRHPEKINKPINLIKKKPEWIRSKIVNSKIFFQTKQVVNQNNLVTVCEEANCPNITECWSKKHATFMIMGDTCTRACAFCDVKTGMPTSLDIHEPSKISNAVKKLNLKHVVITSVDRDDLEDGGSNHFYKVVTETRKKNPGTSIEVLTPDFLRKGDAYKKILEADFDVFNHNIETVPRLYTTVRPGARYFASLELLKNAKKFNKKVFTKSGIMVGLGENKEEINQVMDDLRSAEVDFITIGQYLQPSVKHHPLNRYYHPEEFKELETIAKTKGFLLVSSSPLTRSSYHADEDFRKLQDARKKKNRMSSASVKKIIPCKKNQLIEMVLDIEKYPEFVPWCIEGKILNKKESEDLIIFDGDLKVGKSFLNEIFSSQVSYYKEKDKIIVTNLDGPLKHLKNEWIFKEVNNKTQLEFFIDFELKNPILNAIMKKSFELGLSKIAKSFVDRAIKLYK